MSPPNKDITPRSVRSPFPAEKTWMLINDMIVPAKNFWEFLTPAKHSLFRVKGLAMEDFWVVWLPGQGMVQVWVEDDPSGIRVAAQACPPGALASRRALARLKASSLMVMALILLVGGILMAAAWAKEPIARTMLVLGPLAVLAGLWRQLSWRAEPEAADQVLTRLATNLVQEAEGNRIGTTKLEAHRLDVMRRLKEEGPRRTRLSPRPPKSSDN